MAIGSTSTGLAGSKSNHPVKIFANIFISFIGAGVLGLPYAFKEAGILEGILTMTFVAVVSAKAMLLIIDCKYKVLGRKVTGIPHGMSITADTQDDDGIVLSETYNRHQDFSRHEESLMIRVKEPKPYPKTELSYGDIGFHAMGRVGQVLVDIAIVVSQTGFCCAYIIFISENLSDYIKGVKLEQWLLILLPPLFLLTLLRHLSSLALSSMLAQVSNLMAFGVVFWFDFEHLFKITIHPKEMSVKGFPFFFAIAIYCYEGAGMILALESSVAEEMRHKFRKFFRTAMFIITSLYITFGACGYLSFGPDTNPIITLNLPRGEGLDFAMVVKSCLCLGIFFTYPVMMFPVIKILENYLLPDAGKSAWKANVLRFCLVVVTGFVVLAIPNFANLMALVGASCCTLLAFILPAIFHLYIFKGSLSRPQKLLDYFLICVGVFGTIVGTLDALKRLSVAPGSKHIAADTFSDSARAANLSFLSLPQNVTSGFVASSVVNTVILHTTQETVSLAGLGNSTITHIFTKTIANRVISSKTSPYRRDALQPLTSSTHADGL